MEKIKDILMKRDRMTEEEAEDLIDEAKTYLAKRRLEAREIPYDICEDLFGLEPDYIEELM